MHIVGLPAPFEEGLSFAERVEFALQALELESIFWGHEFLCEFSNAHGEMF